MRRKVRGRQWPAVGFPAGNYETKPTSNLSEESEMNALPDYLDWFRSDRMGRVSTGWFHVAVDRMGAKIPGVANRADWQCGKWLWLLNDTRDKNHDQAREYGLALDDRGPSVSCPQCARLRGARS